MSGVLAALAGAATVVGLLVAFTGATRVHSDHATARVVWRRLVPKRRTGRESSWARLRWLASLVAALSAWLISGWPIAGVIAAVTVAGLPVLLSTSRVAARAIDRVEAVEAWTRRLADVLVVGVGLEQAIAATVRTCPAPIQPEVTALAARLSAHWPTETAVRAFATDLNDATGDLVAASLILASRRRGPGLARVLASVADSVGEDVAVRRKVEAERAKPRTTARAVTVITLGVVAVGSLNGTYLRPYGTALGQLVLAAIATGFVASLAWMRALTLSSPAPRFLASAGSAGHRSRTDAEQAVAP